MKIKSKLRLGFGFLFLMVLLFGGFSGFYLKQISEHSKVILKDNYESLRFTREMRTVLDNQELPLSKDAISSFDEQLKKQEANITEPGEAGITRNIRKDFETLKSADLSIEQMVKYQRSLRNHLRNVEKLNMEAIVRKNDQAQRSVKKASIYMSLIGSFIIIILFSFSVNFPGFIANPLLELTEGIKEISRKNYRTRMDFSANDEFAPLAIAFNQMATKLNDWENSNLSKVMSEKQRIETIIEQMQDGIIGLNEKGNLIFINPAAEQLLNLNEEKTIGLNVAEISKKNDLLKTLTENKQSDKPIKIYANGKESYFQLEVREITIPVYPHNEEQTLLKSGRSAGEVYILRNITKFTELDEAKTNFIATISHELKTPISAIKMSIKLIEDERVGKLNTEQLDLLNHIKDDSDRLLKITSELLDLAQVETGNIQLNFIPTEPDEIVNYAINAVKFQADQKQVSIEIHSRPNLSKVNVDVEKTTWVLINLLSNALRYSPEKGKVVIQVENTGQYIEFSVQDFGKGIEEQYQARLFDRYFKVPTDGKNKSGTGLGLAISKDFIEAQKGEIFVESELGAGSRFVFRLPVYTA
ncbi:MAG TPA: ATP-binding protein [Daejeonella sp.]|uniref:ATP-binding protein n=1 Tax=Daejeonella sp. TaxID=2805397 RepID=UPI002ED7FE83